MILSCPSCNTRYNLDAAALRGGLTVRCVKCGNSWHQDPPDDMPIVVEVEVEDEPEVPEEEESAPEPAQSEKVDVPPVVRRRPALEPETKSLPVAWIVLAATVVALLSIAIGFRDGIASAWPPAARLYEAMWLPVEPQSYGLELRDLASSQTFDGDVPMLSITGQVTNVSAEARMVPRVRVGLTNEAGREIYHWTFIVPDRELQAGQSTRFSTTLASPPESAKHLAVTFLED